MDRDRRKVFKAVAEGGGAMLASGFLGAIANELFNTIYKPKEVGEAEKEALGVLFGESDALPSLYAGEGNILARAKGLKGISKYLGYSAEQFSSYIGRAFKAEFNLLNNNGGEVFSYDTKKDSLFLGGAAANDITSGLLGYKEKEMTVGNDVVLFPTADRANTVTRWVQLYGETGYGIYNGKQQLARRYSARTGKEVERPIYKILDKKTGKTLEPIIENDFLMSEWLTIVRIRDAFSTKVIIGGMHGYSTEAFCRNISVNLERLSSVVGTKEQYQVIVPVTLSHKLNRLSKLYTVGDIDWKNAKAHEIYAQVIN